MSNFNQRNLDTFAGGGGNIGGQFNLLTRNPSGDLSPSARKTFIYQAQQQQQLAKRNFADDEDIEINSIGFNQTITTSTNGLLEKLQQQQASPQSQFSSFTQNQQNYFNQTQTNTRTGHTTPPIQVSTNQTNILGQLSSGASSPNSRTANNQFNFRASNNQLSNLLQQQQQQQQVQLQKKLGSTNNLNFSNINSLANTIARPQSTNTIDMNFPQLDPSEFPTLNRTNSQNIANRINSFSNVPQSAPILTSQQQANIQSLLTNSLYSQSNNSPTPNNNVLQNLTNQLQNINPFNSHNINNNNNSNNLQHHQQQQQQQHQQSNTSTSGKMWSSFGSSLRDNNMMKYSQENQQEFQIQQEDFPALPRSQTDGSNSDTKQVQQQLSQTNNQSQTQQVVQQSQQSSSVDPKSTNLIQTPLKKGIQIYPDGRVKNVPSNMLLDQFGIVGLLAYFKADREKDMFSLALGTDLTALGLNLNSSDLFHTFLSPFSDVQCRLQDVDYPVPSEYIINYQIKDKLAKIDINRYNDDLLFYLFYMNCGDLIQLQAACVLYDKDWRYHVDKRVWLTKVQGLQPQIKTQEYEKGFYIVFDAQQWKRLQMEMTIEYAKLAEKPNLAAYAQR